MQVSTHSMALLALVLMTACSPGSDKRQEQSTTVFQSDVQMNGVAERALAGDAGAAQALSDHFWPNSPALSNHWLRVSVENGGTKLAMMSYAAALRKRGGYCNLIRARFALSRAVTLAADPLSDSASANDPVIVVDQKDPDVMSMLEDVQKEIDLVALTSCADQILDLGQRR